MTCRVRCFFEPVTFEEGILRSSVDFAGIDVCQPCTFFCSDPFYRRCAAARRGRELCDCLHGSIDGALVDLDLQSLLDTQVVGQDGLEVTAVALSKGGTRFKVLQLDLEIACYDPI